MNRPHRLKALLLAEYMMRAGVRSLTGKTGGGRRMFVFDASSGAGTGHRLPAQAGPGIILAANRLASRARRRGGRIEPKDIGT